MLKMAVINEQTILDGYAYPNISLLGEIENSLQQEVFKTIP